jgi:hypothetical protein
LTITFAGLDAGLLKKDACKANWCGVCQIRCYRLFPETLSCAPKPSPDVDNFRASRAADSMIDGYRPIDHFTWLAFRGVLFPLPELESLFDLLLVPGI